MKKMRLRTIPAVFLAFLMLFGLFNFFPSVAFAAQPKTQSVSKAVYTITATVNKAAYGSVKGGGVYKKGTSVTLTATPKTGCYFAYWLEGSKKVSTKYKYSFTVSRTRKLKAVFAKIGKPTITATSIGYNRVKVSWKTVKGAKSYQIYRAVSGGAYKKIATTTSKSYVNTGLTTGKVYKYKVRARWTGGSITRYGSFSPYKSVKPVPSKPANLKTSVNGNNAKLSWKAVSGATKYQVYRATSKNGTYKKITETASTSYTNTGLTGGKTYYYKVRAYRLKGSSRIYGPFCAAVSAKPLAVPTGFSAKTGARRIVVKWNSVSGATKYQLYRKSSSTGAYTKIADTASLSYTNTGLTPGKKYYYKVRAYRLDGSKKIYGSFSSVVSAAAREPLEPSGTFVLSSRTDQDCIVVGFMLTNNGSKTIRIYNSNCWLEDYDFASFDRDLQLLDENANNISYLDIHAGATEFVGFGVIGEPTWYDANSKIHFEFAYDTIRYSSYASYNLGCYYWEKE